MRKFVIALFLLLATAFTVIAGAVTVLADASVGDTVITLGNDLRPEEKEAILKRFGAENAKIITVTNEEEHRYLDGILSKNVIGTRAISSAMIQIAEPGSGIKVETNNITWVTKAMYENALATAGVKDATVKVDAPFPVSGTAALTGIMKAYETATGKKISDEMKKIANEEMVATAQLGESIGNKEKAAELLTRLKEEMSKQAGKLSDNELRDLIQKIATQMGLNLSGSEIDSLVSILRKIQNMNIDWNQVLDQITSYQDEIKQYLDQNPQAKSFVQEIFLFLKQLIDSLLSWLKG